MKGDCAGVSMTFVAAIVALAAGGRDEIWFCFQRWWRRSVSSRDGPTSPPLQISGVPAGAKHLS